MDYALGLDRLIDAIMRVSGLVPRHDWTSQLWRRLEVLAGLRGTTTEALLENSAEWSSMMPELLNAVTIGETFFFRHREHFDFLVDEIGALLNGASFPTPRILSAGCASGEEPFSMAIAIHSKLGAEALSRVEILASDISPDAIRKARAGVYGAWAFRDAPSWLRHEYFQHTARAGLQIADVIRKAVTFEVANVLHHVAALPRSYFDVVFFRNVSIYLRPSTIADIYCEFQRVLKPRGVLVVASGDPRPSTSLFVDIEHSSTSIYRSRVMSDEFEIAVAPKRMTSGSASSSALPALLAGQTTPTIRPVARSVEVNTSKDAAARYRDAEVEALRIADMGDLAAVNATITTMFTTPATAPTGYVIRGHLSLDSGQPEAAVEDLRHALFLRPEHRLARYWYVLALQAIGQLNQAMTQSNQLEVLLGQTPGDAVLEDGETTANQLLEAIQFVKEGLS